MKKFFVITALAVSYIGSSFTFAGDTYRDTRGVVRRNAPAVAKPEKQRRPGSQQGTPVNLQSIVNALRAQNAKPSGVAGKDNYLTIGPTSDANGNPLGIKHPNPGSVSSVYGQQQKRNPTGFKAKKEPKAKDRSPKQPGAYKNIYNQYDENGNHVLVGWN